MSSPIKESKLSSVGTKEVLKNFATKVKILKIVHFTKIVDSSSCKIPFFRLKNLKCQTLKWFLYFERKETSLDVFP
jgi:hypothetical protein